jgi:hypothetical protein
MSTTTILDAVTYETRRAELAEHHKAALAEYRRVALQREIGAGGQTEVDEAGAAVTANEQRQQSLDDAWAQAQADAARLAAEADADRRRQACAKVAALLAEGSSVLSEIVDELKLGELTKRYDEITEQIVETLRPFFRDIGGESGQFVDLIKTLRSRAREADLIAGLLFAEGVWNVGNRQAWFNARERGLDWLNESRRQQVLRHAEKILPAEELQEDEQQEAA